MEVVSKTALSLTQVDGEKQGVVLECADNNCK